MLCMYKPAAQVIILSILYYNTLLCAEDKDITDLYILRNYILSKFVHMT